MAHFKQRTTDEVLPLQLLPDGRYQLVILRAIKSADDITNSYLPLLGSAIFDAADLADDTSRNDLKDLVMVDAHERINFSGVGSKHVALVFETISATVPRLLGGGGVARDLPGAFQTQFQQGTGTGGSHNMTMDGVTGLKIGQTIAVLPVTPFELPLFTTITNIAGLVVTMADALTYAVSDASVFVLLQNAREFTYRYAIADDGSKPAFTIAPNTAFPGGTPPGGYAQYLVKQESNYSENKAYSIITRVYRELPGTWLRVEMEHFHFPGSLTGNQTPQTILVPHVVIESYYLKQPLPSLVWQLIQSAKVTEVLNPLDGGDAETRTITHEDYIADGYSFTSSGDSVTWQGVTYQSVVVTSTSLDSLGGSSYPSGGQTIASDPIPFEGNMWLKRDKVIKF